MHLHIWIKYVHTCGSEFLHMETYFQVQAQSLWPRRINPALDSSWTPSWLFPQTHESETSIRTCTHGGDSRGFYLQSLSNHSFTLLWNLSSSSPSLPPARRYSITLSLYCFSTLILSLTPGKAILLSYISHRRLLLCLPADYPDPSPPRSLAPQ